MGAAPDLNTLYQFEDNFENAFVTILTALELTAVTQRTDAELATPRVALQFTLGAASGHEAFLPNGERRFDLWAGVLQLQIVTNRTKNAVSHSSYRATVRNAMAALPDNSTLELPYYDVARVIESATSPTINTTENQDVSTLSYAVTFAIRRDAWPS